MSGKTRLYSGIGPLRYQKRVNLGSSTEAEKPNGGLWESLKKLLTGTLKL
jgi:hypothetical protein